MKCTVHIVQIGKVTLRDECGVHTLRDPSGYPSGGSPLIGTLTPGPIAIRVPLRMGSSSHGGERKGQLGPGVTVPMSGLPPEGYPEGSRRVWTHNESYA